MGQVKTITIRVLLLAIGVNILFACGKDKKAPKNTDEPSKVDLNVTDTQSTVIFEDKSITEIYTQYLKVKAALVNTNNSVARAEAKKLEDNIPENEAYKQLKATTKLFKLTKDINKQRDFFVTITEEVEKLVANNKIVSGEVYKQFCPMAFDGNGGYWLSDSKEVRNPYYGNKMLICGSVKQTIK